MEPGKDETMTEIEKMYKLANVKAINIAEYGSTYIPKSIKIDGKLYPPFTAEKQLEIVQYILFSKWWMNLKRLQFAENFEEALAGLVNDLWQDLTEEERKQIRSILND